MSGRKSAWEWYAVLLLFESTISGEPNASKIDEHYRSGDKLYEERIVIFRAQSANHAYKLADLDAKKSEMTYKNPYDQTVHCRFIDSINCQRLFDDKIISGTEIYHRLFKKPENTDIDQFIATYFPETQRRREDGDVTPFYNFLINE